jgi:hypothetical protein
MRKMNVKAYLKIKVIKDGKCIYYRRYRSKSFVGNYILSLNHDLADVNLTLVNTSGATFGTGLGNSSLNVRDAGNDDSFGIQIGAGTTAPAITDYRLTQLIPNGIGPGQMQYQGVNVFSPVINTSNNTGYFTVARAFTNNSGGSITVSEVGLVASYFGQHVLIIHDLLPTPITVPNGSTLSIAYEIQVAT